MTQWNAKAIGCATLLAALLVPTVLLTRVAESQSVEHGEILSSTDACDTNRVSFRTATKTISTNSTSFVNAPATFQTITVGGTAPSCVIVVFSGESSVLEDTIELRPRIPGIGGAGNSEPLAVFFEGRGAGEHPTWRTQSMQFVFPAVPPGQHTVRIHYRSFHGSTVWLGRRTLTIHYSQ